MSQNKRQVIESVFEHAQAGRWTQALDESRGVAALFPDDARLRSLVSDLALRCAAGRPVGDAPIVPETNSAAGEARDRAFWDAAVRERAQRQGGATASMGDLVQDSRRISDIVRKAAISHIDDDVPGLLAAARASLAQDLLPEAMRLCQKVLMLEPANEQVKGLLMEISRRKGL